jgi:hypothetical protein
MRTSNPDPEILMSDYLGQIQGALSKRFYLPALMACVGIPDICGALDHEGISKPRFYKYWFEKYAKAKFLMFGKSYMDGDDCYALRCALLHQGKSSSPKHKLQFVNFNKYHLAGSGLLAQKDGGLIIDTKKFCNNMIDAAFEWLDEVHSTPRFKKNSKNFIRVFNVKLTFG